MEKPEINLEKIQLLIDKLTSQVSNHSAIEHLLPTAQMLVAELQQAQVTAKPRPSVSVVMPGGIRSFRQADTQMEGGQGPVSAAQGDLPQSTTEAPQIASPRSFALQPPTVITEQLPEQTMDTQSYLPVSDVTPVTEIAAHTYETAPSPADNIAAAKEAISNTDAPAIEPAGSSKRPDGPAGDNLHPGSSPAFTSFPTSIPADTPEIQHESEGGTTEEDTAVRLQEAATAAAPNPSPAAAADPADPSGRYQHPDDPSGDMDIDTEHDSAGHLPIPDNYPDFQEKGNDKQKHLDFIHENFSAWSDYGSVSEVPTLVQHHPLQSEDQQKDLNERFREDREEWAQTLQSTPIDNLAGAIGINDRYLFISELFRGDESMYERSILTLNKFNDYSQAHAWSERELRLKLGWDVNNPITRQFEQLVKRRFMTKTAQ